MAEPVILLIMILNTFVIMICAMRMALLFCIADSR